MQLKPILSVKVKGKKKRYIVEEIFRDVLEDLCISLQEYMITNCTPLQMINYETCWSGKISDQKNP